MDPMSIISLTGNIIQFIQFAAQLVSKGRKISESKEGALIDHVDLSATATHLVDLSKHVTSSLRTLNSSRSPSETDQKLRAVCQECSTIASELIGVLERLRLHDRRSKWRSTRQAFKSICGQKTVNNLKARLESFRGVLDTTLLVALREQMNEKLGASNASLADLRPRNTLRSRQVDELVDMARNMRLNPKGQVEVQDLQTFSARLTSLSEEETSHKLSQRIITALLFEDKEEREFRICKAHQQTYRWVFERGHREPSRSWSDIGTWLEGDQDIYWITGKPGSGKSTFVKFLSREPRTLHHLKKWAGNTPLVIARFYFWNSGTVAQMSQMGLLRSLLHDILQVMPHLVLEVFPQRWRISKLLGQDTRSWTLSELMNAFKTVMKCCETSFKLCMFVDGLDEFSGSHERLVELFKEVVSYPNVKACLSSRPWIVFEDAFSQKANLQLHDLTYPDVRAFTQASFHLNRHFLQIQSRDPDRSSALIEAVATRAAGVFLWVDLAVRSLLSGLSNRDRMSDLQRRLNEIPPDLETFYEKMFESIEDFYFEHACQLLQIVGEAKGRLTVLELSFADEEDFEALLSRQTAPLSSDEKEDRYESTKRRLNSRCKGFLEIPTWLPTVDAAQTQEQQDSTVMAEPLWDRRQQMRPSLGDVQSINVDTVNNQAIDLSPTYPADVKVSYLHRTARDFLHSPKMKQQIQMGIKKPFCPFFPLFHSSILSLKIFDGPVDQRNQPKLWEHIENSLEYAAECEAWSGTSQTRLLRMVDEAVTIVSMTKAPSSRSEQYAASGIDDNSHWTTSRRDGSGSGGFVDLAAKYNMPLYILQTIKSGLKESGQGDPDIHRCLFHIVRDFKNNAGVCEWVGCRVPRLSFITFLLKRGADPNKYYNSVNSFEIVLSEAVEVAHDATITEKRRSLEHWAVVIEEFIKYNGNPKANRNSAVGSSIREAFGKLLPERARHLERMMKRSGSRWSAARKYIVPPLVGRSSSMEIDQIPLPVFNRTQRAQASNPYLATCASADPVSQEPSHHTVFWSDTPEYYHHWEKPPAPYPQFRHPEELRASNPANRARLPICEAMYARQTNFPSERMSRYLHDPPLMRPEQNNEDGRAAVNVLPTLGSIRVQQDIAEQTSADIQRTIQGSVQSVRDRYPPTSSREPRRESSMSAVNQAPIERNWAGAFLDLNLPHPPVPQSQNSTPALNQRLQRRRGVSSLRDEQENDSDGEG